MTCFGFTRSNVTPSSWYLNSFSTLYTVQCMNMNMPKAYEKAGEYEYEYAIGRKVNMNMNMPKMNIFCIHEYILIHEYTHIRTHVCCTDLVLLVLDYRWRDQAAERSEPVVVPHFLAVKVKLGLLQFAVYL